MSGPEIDSASATTALTLAPNVIHLDPETAVYESMVAGWCEQQRARFLRTQTIEARISVVRRFATYTGLYPWQWRPAEAEAWFAHLASGTPSPAFSTVRGYQLTLRLFCDYLTDRRYGWIELCANRFGETPTQILHEWNSIVHVTEFEGRPGRRALTYDEVQVLFDTADSEVERVRGLGRKGSIQALRNAVLLKTVYAYGLRRSEAVGLDLADLRTNPSARDYGRFGGLYVRWGKSSRGSPPKRRTVLTVPEMDWIVEVLEHYFTQVRTLFGADRHPAVWLTERCGRITTRSANDAFTAVRDAAGLPQELDLHSLRHSYITHLIEFGYPERFVQAIYSPEMGVRHVHHAEKNQMNRRRGGGYLLPSITQISRRFDARTEGADARFAA
ncbi:tyrosine-type recombinase/integrase [Nocardia sp. SYP-A9097]|uniref:tyrosine-type recombinase/integrase n=1 Tax=Nocardia sp. SYP-A9097 TaxID=2663237 RepID=UPI00129A711B|nr:tyrosine-type recombinase/integrase [Nocardia sp. SYP-A9097]MRH92349.1 tyrosine-type recombinase/integrase [Nocardia sp. SYP-A9097]